MEKNPLYNIHNIHILHNIHSLHMLHMYIAMLVYIVPRSPITKHIDRTMYDMYDMYIQGQKPPLTNPRPRVVNPCNGSYSLLSGAINSYYNYTQAFSKHLCGSSVTQTYVIGASPGL